MDPVRPWPKVAEEGQWAVEELDEMFATTTESPERLRQRAVELRAEAERTDIHGYRLAALELAERYEQAAGSRAATR